MGTVSPHLARSFVIDRDELVCDMGLPSSVARISEKGGGADQSKWVSCISTPKLGESGGMLPQENFEIVNLGDSFWCLLRPLLVLVYYHIASACALSTWPHPLILTMNLDINK